MAGPTNQDKTVLPFNELIQFVNDRMLSNQLIRILKFLKSDGVELPFNTSTSGNMDAVLMRIAQNRDNLICLLYHPSNECRDISEKIMEKLTENEFNYTLCCRYDRDEHGNKILIYTKLCPNEQIKSNSFESLQFKESEMDTDRLVLEKVLKPKMQSEEIQDKTEVKDRMSQHFIKVSSQTILDFMKDEYRASLIFENVKPLEELFLQSVMTSRKVMCEEHETLLAYYNTTKVTQEYDLKVDVIRVNRKTKLKDVMFSKVPKFDDKCITENLDKFKKISKFPVVGYFDPVSPDRNRSMQSAADRRNYPGLKTKLIEALSVPVESNKAMKMMKSMGWTGGPLGKRGDGITEPIIPHLNQVSRTGLGHVPDNVDKPPMTQSSITVVQPAGVEVNVLNNSIMKFKIEVYKSLIELLEAESDIKIMRFQKKLTETEMSFVAKFLQPLNSRSCITLDTVSELQLVRQLAENMSKDHRIVITTCYDDNYKRLTFVKSTERAMKIIRKRSSSKYCAIDQAADGSWPTSFPLLSKLTNYEKKYNFRVFIQGNLTVFLKNENETQKELYFDVAPRKRAVIAEVLKNINNAGSVYSIRGIDIYESDIIDELCKVITKEINIQVEYTKKKCTFKKVKVTEMNSNSDAKNDVKSDVIGDEDITDTDCITVLANTSISDCKETNGNGNEMKYSNEMDNLTENGWGQIISKNGNELGIGKMDKFGTDYGSCHRIPKNIEESANIVDSNNPNRMYHPYKISPLYRDLSNNSKSSKKVFRIELSKILLKLLQSEPEEIVVSFDQRLSKDKISYAKYLITCLNTRTRLSVSDTVEINLVTQLKALMKNNLMLSGTVNGEKKLLTIKKKMLSKSFDKNVPVQTELTKEDLHIREKADGSYPVIYQLLLQKDNRVAEFNFNVFILVHILELLKNKQQNYIELFFGEDMTSRNDEYLKSVVRMVNTKEMFKHYTSSYEKNIMCNICDYYDGVNLKLVQPKDCFRKITLIKTYIDKDDTKTNVVCNSFEDIQKTMVHSILKPDNKDSSYIVKESTLHLENVIKPNTEHTSSVSVNEDNVIKHAPNNESGCININVNSSNPFERVIEKKALTYNDLESNDDTEQEVNEYDHMEIVDDKVPTINENKQENLADNQNTWSESDVIGNDIKKLIIHDPLINEANSKVETAEENKTIDTPLLTCNKRSLSNGCIFEISKKTKISSFENIKKVSVVPNDFPARIITKESMIDIQSIICNSIDKEEVLPLLQCRGIQNGCLVYACHNDISLLFLKNILNSASGFKIIENNTNEYDYNLLEMKMNFLCDDANKIFHTLESYNTCLNTKLWVVTNFITNEDNIVMILEVDKKSYDYIYNNNFCLYAGVDTARFNIVWK
ncbi:uncharacterized protein LOC131855340 isoform X2 [Achroia grisella]|uniref:uncharacterized protein LOC131855340 isoform X2 n=1 Tax=Achroia grisella TaxID=688607 RepID=UPI0027D20879|nr:uncharacterized protein LOC131855340 isoform X2 [Achroia grisella]